MSQFRSFFINACDSNCDELNQFFKSHVIIRTVENIISAGNNCGIHMLVEYRDVTNGEKQNRRIDWRESLKTEEEKLRFDKLKEFRAKLTKEKKLGAAYLICKDEHLALIVQKPLITVEEIKEFPHAGNIMLKENAEALFNENMRILNETGQLSF